MVLDLLYSPEYIDLKFSQCISSCGTCSLEYSIAKMFDKCNPTHYYYTEQDDTKRANCPDFVNQWAGLRAMMGANDDCQHRQYTNKIRDTLWFEKKNEFLYPE